MTNEMTVLGTFYRVELGNKIRNGRCVGNLYLVRKVDRMSNGGERTNPFTECDSIDEARSVAANMNAKIAQSYSGLAR